MVYTISWLDMHFWYWFLYFFQENAIYEVNWEILHLHFCLIDVLELRKFIG